MTPTPGQTLNRGNNLLVSGFLVSLATGLIGLRVSETEWIDRLDDGLVIFLAVVTAGGYLGKDHRYTWSLVPFGLLALSFPAKLTGFSLETGDPASSGDGLGILPTIGSLPIITGFLQWKTYPGRTMQNSSEEHDTHED